MKKNQNLKIYYSILFLVISHNINGDSVKYKSNYKGSNIESTNYLERMYSYSNPYEYNIDTNYKDKIIKDIEVVKSITHEDRRKQKLSFFFTLTGFLVYNML